MATELDRLIAVAIKAREDAGPLSISEREKVVRSVVDGFTAGMPDAERDEVLIRSDAYRQHVTVGEAMGILRRILIRVLDKIGV